MLAGNNVSWWKVAVVCVVAVVLTAWLLRYDRWETSQGETYVLDRWTGDLRECLGADCHTAY